MKLIKNFRRRLTLSALKRAAKILPGLMKQSDLVTQKEKDYEQSLLDVNTALNRVINEGHVVSAKDAENQKSNPKKEL